MRKKVSLFALLLGMALMAKAQIADGYYRVQNTKTKRYMALYDNKAKLDKVATDADLKAIRSFHDYNRIVSDPASIIYFKNVKGKGYELAAQGANTTKMLGEYYLQLKPVGKTYMAYGTYSGVSVFLSDEVFDNERKGYTEPYDSMGYMLTSGEAYKYWFVKPVSADDDSNYFGFSPNLQVGSDYYQSFYAEFPFSFYSSGMKAYYVDKISDEKAIAELREVATEVIPGATPIIVKTASANASDNRILLQRTVSSPLTDNKLTGVYFCSSKDLVASYDQILNHENYVRNDPATMRVLAVEDGVLVLKKSTGKYIPRNSFYLKVKAGSPEVYRLLLPEAYATGISMTTADQRGTSSAVYTVSGQKVSDNGTQHLPHGLYIQNGRKIVVK